MLLKLLPSSSEKDRNKKENPFDYRNFPIFSHPTSRGANKKIEASENCAQASTHSIKLNIENEITLKSRTRN